MLQTSKSDLVEIRLDDHTSRGIGHNGIEITIDRGRCRYSMYDPKGCKKCIQVCPVGVFSTRPIEKRDFSIPPRERVDPTQWVLLATWADWCNGCAACLKECGRDALTIKFGDRALGA